MKHIAPLMCLCLVASCGEDTLSKINPEQTTQGTGPAGPSGPWGPSGPVNPNPPPPGQTNDPPATCQTGALMGRLCLPGQDVALAGAAIFIYATDCLGNTELYQTTAADNGQFSMAGLPEGTHNVQVEHPQLSTTFAATVTAGQISIADTMDPNAPMCITTAPPRLALIDGEYDSVHNVLDGLELTYDRFDYFGLSAGDSEAYAFLSVFSQMTEYDVLFFNCGSMERDFLNSTVDYGTGLGDDATITFDFNAQIYDNLRSFVLHGGNIYASDWAWPVVEALKPDVVDWYGDESNGANVLKGNDGAVTGNILDNQLALFLGTNTVAIDFDLGAWAVIESVTTQAQVFVTGDVEVTLPGDPLDPFAIGATQTLYNKPLLVGFRPFAGGGFVMYTTFHYHAQPSQQMVDTLEFLIFQL